MQIIVSTKIWIERFWIGRSRIAGLVGRLQHALLLICVLLAGATAAPISRDNVRFRSYSTPEGLSQATIRAIAQDSTGLMWFGTQDGLNRFDGYDFKTFYRDSQVLGTISDNHILSLASDHPRTGLWIGTQSRGLNFLDLKLERFRAYRAGQFGLNSDQINSLVLNANGTLWLATGAGVTHFDPNTERVLSHLPIPGANFVTLDAQGAPIVATSTGVLRAVSGQLQRWPDEPWRYGAAQVVTLDRAGEVWVGLTNGGLLHFNASGMLLQHFKKQVSEKLAAEADAARCEAANTCVADEYSLPGDEVRGLMITKADELWVSTMTGSAIYDRKARRFVRFMYDPGDPTSLPANRAQALFEDRSQQLWVGTWRAGVAVHNPKTRSVSVIHQHIDSEAIGNTTQRGLPGNSVRAIWREPDGTLWLGILENGGLVHYDFARGVLARFVHKPNDPTSMASNSIQSILRTRKGELWVATNGGGLNQLINPAATQGPQGLNSSGFIRYGTREPSPRNLNSDKILALFEDRDGTLWASSDDQGLLARCPGCDSFEAFLDSDGRALPLTINAIFRTKNGTLLLGAQGQGLIVLNSETRKIRRFRATDLDGLGGKSSTGTELSHDSVTSIFETSNGAIWLGTQGGGVNHVIFEGDPFTDKVRFQAVRKSDGLGSDAVGAILEDRNGNLWVSTTVGIGVLDLKTMKSQELTESQGMDQSGYYLGSATKDEDGSLMFGGLGGLIRFNPLELTDKPALEQPVLTDMRLLNLPLALNWQSASSPLTAATPFASNLTLSDQQNMWTIEFSALNFGYAYASQYQYRLLGSSPDWVNTALAQRSATFTNLPAGNYRFEVRTVSGEYISASTALALVVLPPPWLSMWAKALYTALALLLSWLFYLQVRRRVTEKLRDAELIERSEALLKHALWGSRDELWDLDLRSGQMQAVNPLTDLKLDRFNPRHGPIELEQLVKIAHPADRVRLKLALSAHIDEGTEYFEAAFRMRTVDDDWAWVMGRGRAIERDAQGRAVRLVGTLRDISDVKAVEDELRSVNERLEDRVSERTLALSASNAELSSTLATLKNTQRQLVDSEKMASLGNLVAGVAHEINTPLGIGVTAASHLRQETERLARHLEKNTLSKAELEQFTKSAVEASDLVLKNLDRASKLVRSFKQVAVDQGSEALRTIVLGSYLEEVLFTLKPTLKRTQHHIDLAVPARLTMETYPGALSQIIFNLVTNSLTHAFPERNDGKIEISADLISPELSGGLILLRYRDNGIGMPEIVRSRIFEPFFTTKRGQGGSGLGMHVVYNLVTQLLKGSIQCVSTEGVGTEIIIQIPMRSV